MNNGDSRGDLFVLVADQDMEQTVRGLLARPESLEMAPVNFDVGRHPRRDSGCRTGAVEYLRAVLRSYRHALVMFDLHGSGSHRTREETQRENRGGAEPERLEAKGQGHRHRAGAGSVGLGAFREGS